MYNNVEHETTSYVLGLAIFKTQSEGVVAWNVGSNELLGVLGSSLPNGSA